MHREIPLACRTITALRYPYPARLFAQKFLVRLNAGSHLRPYRFVGAEKREVSVRRRTGEHFNSAGVIEFSKSGDDVLIQRFKVLQRQREEILPILSNVRQVLVAFFRELGFVNERRL